MPRLDLAAVMDALAAAPVQAGLLERGYGWPNPSVNPPAIVVGYPTSLELGITASRGSDRGTFPVWLVLGRIEERTTRDTLASYMSGQTGDIVDAIEDAAVNSCRVMGVVVESWVPAPELTYLAIRFDVDVLT